VRDPFLLSYCLGAVPNCTTTTHYSYYPSRTAATTLVEYTSCDVLLASFGRSVLVLIAVFFEAPAVLEVPCLP
jgi:hypothetical protein